jgi:TAG lipase / steryl ester hydrolase / phospholipase A2 / LPA acyltransferase
MNAAAGVIEEATDAAREPLRVVSHENTPTYETWKAAALADDAKSGADRWRAEDRSRRYDYKVIRRRYDEIRAVKAAGDPLALLYYLSEGIHGNTGGMGRPAVYARAKFGTKDLITNYIAELADAIEQAASVDGSVVAPTEKLAIFRRAGLCFGRSALMLSGAGALGPFHVGVTKALLEQDLLPDVISGSSAGSFVAAVIGTHDEATLRAALQPSKLADAFGDLGSGAGISSGRTIAGRQQIGRGDLQAAIEAQVPDLTFEEAFQLTGRKINISVSPSEVHQSSRLLNAVTSPNVCIREAVMASCAVPGVFPAVTLMAKNTRGERLPYVASRKWVDGSIADDLPAKRLARLYGVNHFITSQTNPIVLWALRDSAGDDNLASRLVDVYQTATKEWLKATYPFAMALVKRAYPLNVYVRMAYSVVMQDYTADINIIPKRRLWDPSKLLSVLSADETRRLISEGEAATWPKIEMIRNCTLIGRTLDRILGSLERENPAA